MRRGTWIADVIAAPGIEVERGWIASAAAREDARDRNGERDPTAETSTNTRGQRNPRNAERTPLGAAKRATS
jgi:hypothetical protein